MKFKTLHSSVIITLFCWPICLFSQKLVWDKDHKCQIVDQNFNERISFSYTGGNCKNELLNGQASLKIYNDTTLVATISAEFSDGYVDGEAEYQWSNGKSFKGSVKKNKWTYGEYKEPGISVYTGPFAVAGNNFMGTKNGFGKLVFEGGETFEGYFENGQITLQGTWYFKNGSRWVALKELCTGDELLGMYYESPSDDVGELKRLLRTKNSRSYNYYYVDIMSTPSLSNALAKYLADKEDRYKNYIDGWGRYWGIYDKNSEIFYPFMKGNARVAKNLFNKTVIRFYHIINSGSGVDNHDIASQDHIGDNEIEIKDGSQKEVEELLKAFSYKHLDFTGFLNMADVENTILGLRQYLNLTGTAINQAGFLVNPELTRYNEEGISFLPINGVKGIYLFETDKLSPWKARAKCRDLDFRNDLIKKALEKGNYKKQLFIPWSKIISFKYSEFDNANDGYWLTISGEFINYDTKQKVAGSHTVFVMADYAKLLMKLLDYVKDWVESH
jgi:hypothetical protein